MKPIEEEFDSVIPFPVFPVEFISLDELKKLIADGVYRNGADLENSRPHDSDNQGSIPEGPTKD